MPGDPREKAKEKEVGKVKPPKVQKRIVIEFREDAAHWFYGFEGEITIVDFRRIQRGFWGFYQIYLRELSRKMMKTGKAPIEEKKK